MPRTPIENLDAGRIPDSTDPERFHANATYVFQNLASAIIPGINSNLSWLETALDGADTVVDGLSDNVTAIKATSDALSAHISATLDALPAHISATNPHGVTAAQVGAWHPGNDGPGSGLDSDTLDGVQGHQFMRSDKETKTTSVVNFSHPDLAARFGYDVGSIRSTYLAFFRGNTTRTAYMIANPHSFQIQQDNGANLVLGATAGDIRTNGHYIPHSGLKGGDIGQYIFAAHSERLTGYGFNQTVAGAKLNPASAGGGAQKVSLAGTWRCLGTTGGTFFQGRRASTAGKGGYTYAAIPTRIDLSAGATLWQRIA